MSERIEDLGFENDIPTRKEGVSGIEKYSLTAGQYFIWSRIDGQTSIHELCIFGGQGRDQTFDALRNLADLGLIRLPNRPQSKAQKLRETTLDLIPSGWPTPFEDYEFDESLLKTNSALPDEFRRLVIYYHAHLRRITLYQLFQVERSAGLEEIRDSYYKLSKVFHPDRWYGKDLGLLEAPLTEVFRWLNKSFQTLSRRRRRRKYDALLDQGKVGPWQKSKAQTAATETESTLKHKTNRLRRDAMMARARKLRSQEDLKGAAAYYRRALKLGSLNQTKIELAATLYEGRMELDEALQLLRSILHENSRNYAAMLLEAKIHEAMGRQGELRRVCEDILLADPNNSVALEELKRLEGA